MTAFTPRQILAISLSLFFSLPLISVQRLAAQGTARPKTQSKASPVDLNVAGIIAEAERRFSAGLKASQARKRALARKHFDSAIDVIIESGIDVRGNPPLQSYYLALIERIYQIETSDNTANAQNQVPVFGAQEYIPNANDILSQSYLDRTEQNVTPDQVENPQIATTGVDFKFKLDPLIQTFINYYTGARGRLLMETGLQRSGQFMKMARKIFREEGVPEDITWLGQAESAWQVRAFSSAGASGLWQFKPDLGVRWGLRQNTYVDERNSFEQATRAAARYLKYLANRYQGNWELAMAAYNTGEGNIDSAIERTGVADFWAIYPYIPQETRDYVPSILAIMLIAKSPGKYGFGHVKPMPPMVYDVVQVPTATTLKIIADATDSTVVTVRALNPELKLDTTPLGEAYNVRIPAGRAQQFVATLKQVHVDRRETSNMNLVAVNQGDTWDSLSTRTGISVAQLQEFNSGVDLKVATKIMIPKSHLTLKGVPLDRREFADLIVIAVNPGENWTAIAARTGLRVAQLKELNRGLDLRVATRIVVPRSARSTRSIANKSNTVKAMKDDTIAKIAARYGFDAGELARLNGISVNQKLGAGREIKLPSRKP